jgi:hypothetical protein
VVEAALHAQAGVAARPPVVSRLGAPSARSPERPGEVAELGSHLLYRPLDLAALGEDETILRLGSERTRRVR